MAYVKITEALIDAVEVQVNRMRLQACEPYRTDTVEPTNPIFGALLEDVVKWAWAAAPELRDKLPDEWLNHIRRVDAHLYDDQGCLVKVVRVDCESAGSGRIPRVPHKEFTRYLPDAKLLFHNQSEPVREWATKLSENDAKVAELKQQYNAVGQAITNILRTHKSLNTAIKEVPELEMYVPEEYVQRLHRKVQRSSPEKKPDEPIAMSVDVDRNQLAALGVTHRLTGAN